MDFFTTNGPTPVRINVNGTPYELPRFLIQATARFYAEQRKKQLDACLARIESPESQARFMSYWQPTPKDEEVVAKELLTPDGAPYVVRHCMTQAGVPKAIIDRGVGWTEIVYEGEGDARVAREVVHEGEWDPVLVRDLANELTQAAAAAHRARTKEEDDDPLTREASTPPSNKSMPESKDASGASPVTTPATSEPSSPATT